MAVWAGWAGWAEYPVLHLHNESMTLQEIRSKRKEAAAELEALYGDLDKMRQLHEKHSAAEVDAKGKVRSGEIELEELVRIQAMRQSVEGIISELEQEVSDAEALLSDLEERADREAKHEHLASVAATLTSIRSKHEAAMLDLRNVIRERLDPIIDLELTWGDTYQRGLEALRALGFSGDTSPNANVRAQDAALLAEVENRGVNLPALLEPRYADPLGPWAVKQYKSPAETRATGFEAELNHVVSKAIESARRDRFKPELERTHHEVIAV